MIKSLYEQQKSLMKQIKTLNRKGLDSNPVNQQLNYIQNEIKNELNRLNIGVRSATSPNVAKLAKLEALYERAGWGPELLETALTYNKMAGLTFSESYQGARYEAVANVLGMHGISDKQLNAIVVNVNSGRLDGSIGPILDQFPSNKITVNDVLNLTPKFLAIWDKLTVEVEGDDYFAS